MDKDESAQIAKSILDELRQQTYQELQRFTLEHPDTREVVGPSGKKYQVEVASFWDDRPNGKGVTIRRTTRDRHSLGMIRHRGFRQLPAFEAVFDLAAPTLRERAKEAWLEKLGREPGSLERRKESKHRPLRDGRVEATARPAS